MNRYRPHPFGFILIFLFLFIQKPTFAQYLFVLPLPYPIDYLEKLPTDEVKDIEKEEEVQEAPTTEFRKLELADFRSQKAMGYTFGETFSVPKGLRHQVDFWKLIYHRYSVNQYVIHDTQSMVIYRVVNIGDIERKKINYRSKRRQINLRLNAHKKQIRALLRSVHKKQNKPGTMTDKERKIFDLFSFTSGSIKFLKATYRGRIRSQLGQRERFRQGIIWSGRYLQKMEAIFQAAGIPMEISRLPFVESSFNLRARSKVGASGIWQFIRSTGRRFLKINRAVDERNDPIEATRAAARLLKLNYKSLKSWPLAITAYNHGRGGMMRAVKKVKSHNLVKIIKKYKSRTFGFASKNFYASFLAALEVDLDYERFFGPIKAEAPLEYDEFKMKNYISIWTLIKYTKLSKQVLKRYNPSLTNYVFTGKKFIPKNYILKFPKGSRDSFLAAYHQIPKRLTPERQAQRIYHKVRRGDTLSYLAKRYKTSVGAIRNANKIGKFIYAGQLLVIPK